MSVYFVVNAQGCFLEAIEAESMAEAEEIAASRWCGEYTVNAA